MKVIQTVFLLVVICLSAKAQESSMGLDKLNFYCDVMMNAGDAENRIYAQQEFNKLFFETLKEEDSWNRDFSGLKWIPQLSDSSNTFKVFSWELKVSEEEYEHYGALLMNNGDVFPLSNTETDLEDLEYTTLTSEEWYGALYYRVEAFEANGETMYLLYGHNSFSKFNRIKIVDVLRFEEGKPLFGQEVFYKSTDGSRADVMNRLVLTHSSDASVTTRYNPGLNMLIHDHLITRIGRLEGQGATNLPDGSYVGWELKNGKWYYVEKIYDQVSEEAPRPKPILDGRNKPAFKKNKRN